MCVYVYVCWQPIYTSETKRQWKMNMVNKKQDPMGNERKKEGEKKRVQQTINVPKHAKQQAMIRK